MNLLTKVGAASLAILLVAGPETVQAQAVVMNWAKYQDEPNYQNLTYDVMIPLTNGNFAVGGFRFSGDHQPIIGVIQPNGTFLWRNVYPMVGTQDGMKKVGPLKQMANGDIVATYAIGNDYRVTHLDPATGTEKRGVSVVTPFVGLDSATESRESFIQDNGTVWIVSMNRGSETLADQVVVRRSLTVTRVGLDCIAIQRRDADFFSSDFYNLSLNRISVRDPYIHKVFTGPLGTYLLSISNNHFYDNGGSRINSNPTVWAFKLSSANTVVWSRAASVTGLPQGDSELRKSQVGFDVSGNPRINYTLQIDNGTGGAIPSSKSFVFANADGAVSTPDPAAIFDTQISQNGFLYRSRTDWDPNSQSVFKYGLNGTTFNWGVFDTASKQQKLHRLPWQVTGAGMNGNSLEIKRYQDGNGTLIDTHNFAVAPQEIVYSVAQDGATGNIMVLGLRRLAAGRIGTYIARFSQAPSANGDIYSTPRNTVLNGLSLLRNDRCAVGVVPSITVSPRNGTLALRSDGTFTYTPRAGYVGSDSFVYRIIKPGVTVNSTATAFISVTP